MQPLLTTIGLVLDIIGVVLLFKFGLPPNVRRDGASFLRLEQTSNLEIRKAKLFDSLSWLALILIVSGFVLQILAVWL